MKRLGYGTPEWRGYVARLKRGGARRPAVGKAVAAIVRQVRRQGDPALVRLTKRYDGVRLAPERLRVASAELNALARRADRDLVGALAEMARRITAYHRKQLDRGFRVRLPKGGSLEEVVQPLDSAGVYVPGGAGAYPSSVLMNVIPARVAGVPQIAVMTPPRTLEENPAVAAALALAGAQGCVFRIGGAQAIAALAFGTETVPAVAKVVGPGNAYVTEAKRQLRGTVEIDSEAGPSEVVILADDAADPEWVAADLLAQAEHGSGDEICVLVSPSQSLLDEAAKLVARGAGSVANSRAARRALRRNGALVRVRDLRQGVAAVNELAPEHAEVLTRRASHWARRVVAGAVFAGGYAPVAVGDYGIGPNHVLPTGGSARRASALSVRDFQRRQSRVRMTRAELLRVRRGVVRVAQAEGFRGHARSVEARFEG